MRKCNRAFDAAIVDLFLGDNIPDYLMTKEFFGDLRNCIRSNGAMVMNAFFDDKDDQYFTFSDNYGLTFSAGMEAAYFIKPSNLSLLLRTGYIFPFDNVNTGIKAGMGIIYSNLGFDYSTSFYTEINYTHTVSVKYKF